MTFAGLVKGWTRSTVLPSESERLRAERLRVVALGTLAVVTIALLVLMAMEPAAAARRLVTLLGVVLVISTVLWISRRGHTALSSWIFVLGLVVLVTQRAWVTGGLNAPVLPLYVVFVMMAGMLLSRAGGLVTAVVCLIGSGVLLVGQLAGLIKPATTFAPPVALLVFSAMVLGIALVLQAMIGGAFRAALGRAEDEIAERSAAQMRLDLALELGEIGVWTFDVATQRFTADERTLAARGFADADTRVFSRDEWRDQIHPDDQQQARSWISDALAGAPRWRAEIRTVAPDGSTRHVLSAASSVPGADGGAAQLVGITVDITERKRAELERARLIHDLGERVKELKLLHATAVTAQRPWESTRDLLQHVVSQMPGAWQYPECTEARIIVGDIEVATPGWRETAWRQSVPLIVEGQEGEIEVVYTEEKPDDAEGPFLKEERDLLVSLSEMLGAILDSIATRRDLERLVETRTTEMRAARDVAQQAAKAKGAFLANMSHEIRTPMNAILGYEQLLQAESGLSEAQRRMLDVIRSSGDHLLSLINDILDMSRLEAGRTLLSLQVFDLHALVDDVRSMFTGQAGRRGIALDVQVDAGVPRVVSADPGKVRQVLINLIGNAVKFTDAGGVHVRVRVASIVEVQCVVSIAVEDTGPGIDTSSFDLIFSAFGQAREGEVRGGTGLGLSISRSFARLMDGDISVRSIIGRGSTFTFTFVGTMVDEQRVPTVAQADARQRLSSTDLPDAPAVASIPLRELVDEIPPALVDELREAASRARVTRVIELADAIAAYSPAAALGIRQFADDFRYAGLLEALKGAGNDA